jgi:hypothetical protein
MPRLVDAIGFEQVAVFIGAGALLAIAAVGLTGGSVTVTTVLGVLAVATAFVVAVGLGMRIAETGAPVDPIDRGRH